MKCGVDKTGLSASGFPFIPKFAQGILQEAGIKSGYRLLDALIYLNKTNELLPQREGLPLRHPASPCGLRRIGSGIGSKQDALRSFSGGELPLFCVDLVESISAQGQRYVGVTADLKQSLQQHNQES